MWARGERATIVEVNGFLHGLQDAVHTTLVEPTTIAAWVEAKFGAQWEFPAPTICLLNGKPILRKDWYYEIKPNDVVTFVQASGWFFVAVLFLVAAVYVVSNQPSFDMAEVDAADSVYSLTGQRNKIRLGQPIEAGYGRCRLFPSMAASTYTRFIGNDQWYYGLYSLGHGEWDIDTIQIEDTNIDNFNEVDYEVIAAGGSATLFRDNVDTSAEVGEIELYAPNNPQYASPTWFTANEVGTLADKLEVDVVFPRGVYYSEDDGSLTNFSVTLKFEYQAIDDSGTPTGPVTTLSNPTVTKKTNTPQRFTYSASVTPGRYQVRGYRTSNENGTTRVGEIAQWVGLKAYLPNVATYPVMTIAIKAQATNNLNDRAANRLNVIATRKLPIWNGTTWSAPTATRSIVWAFCDIWRSTYGPGLDDAYLDLDGLLTLDALYTSRGEYFDWVFDKQMSAWDAAKVVAGVGRAEPILIGSKIGMVREGPKTTPVMLFNKENIVKDTFVIDTTFSDITEEDGLEVEFTDPDTFLPEQVLCTLGAETGENPKKYKIAGIQDATHAYREGMFRWSKQRNQRTSISFETGLEGFMLTRFDAIGVSHDLPRWYEGGYIVSISGTLVTLSKDVAFESGATHVIGFSKVDGTLHGPFTCTEGPEPNQVIVAGLVSTDLSFTSNREPSMFCFGVEEDWTQLCVVEEREATGDDTVRVKAFVYSADPHNYDNDFAPGYTSLVRINPTLPSVTSLAVFQFPDNLTMTRVTWNPAEGATDYVVQKSDDGTDWVTVVITKNNWHDMVNGVAETLYIRVAGINGGRGPWKTVGPIQVGTAFSTPMVDDVGNALVDDNGRPLMGPGDAAAIDVASFQQAAEQIQTLTNRYNELATWTNYVEP